MDLPGFDGFAREFRISSVLTSDHQAGQISVLEKMGYRDQNWPRRREPAEHDEAALSSPTGIPPRPLT